MLDATTSLLFSFFPRELGRYRRVVDGWDQVEGYVRRYNGLKDIYISLYDLGLRLDKIWWEVDAPSLEKALESVKALVGRFEREGLPYIPVFSGNRGFHIYVPIKAWNPPNAETAKAVLRAIQEMFADGVKYVDRHGFGNVRQMVRLPNTLRVGGLNYCTYLPPDFVDWAPADIAEYVKEPHIVNYGRGELPDVRQLIDINYVPEPSNKDFSGFDLEPHSVPSDVIRFLKGVVRPCLAEHLAAERDPSFEVRTDLVSELMWLGYPKEFVVDLARRLNWADYDEKKTRYHVSKIYEKGLKPLGCRKLRQHVRCRNCGWFYWW